MMHLFIIKSLFLFTLLLNLNESDAVLEWLFGDGTDQANQDHSTENQNENPIRFEVLSADEKFLDYARTLSDMSPLDACYNIVIYHLKKKCGELTEEELGKLSVQLLNCQSEAENRPVYPCTTSMSLADCTKKMDGTTWNSYQIVGNRARAMCYATQQLQFRRLTEITVNQLVSAATDQIQSLNDLKTGQEQLQSLTSETVRKLYESQQDLLSTQHALREAHDDVFKHIAVNVKEILHEKALIASGNKELATLTENIKQKLDITSQQIQERESIEHKKHERILKDLKDIQDKTEISIKQFELSLEKLLNKYEELDGQYSGMSVNLNKMNVTIHELMSSVLTMSQHLGDKIQWITKLLDGADFKLSSISCCLLHMAYFFLLAVTASFLQFSVPVRLIMMVVIVGNVAAELSYGQSMDFAGLTVFLFTVYFGFRLTIYCGQRFNVKTHALNPFKALSPIRPTQLKPLSRHEVNTLMELLQRFSATVSEQQNYSPSPPVTQNGTVIHDTSFRPSTPPRGINVSRNIQETTIPEALDISVFENRDQFRRSLINQLGPVSRASSRSSTPLGNDSRSSTPSVSSRCLGTTVAGTQCRLPANAGSDYCRRHAQR
ncbi:protein brambleberry-like [Physella acuta]|uniref:protein brambleberry-like n=1 Tax=Physella acuta TaxID=109671 RepID=UPI0027DD606C|nr:protein brambleberry-like [Physella acuta]